VICLKETDDQPAHETFNGVEITRIPLAAIVRVEGSTRVGGVLVRDGETTRRVRADALASRLAREGHPGSVAPQP